MCSESVLIVERKIADIRKVISHNEMAWQKLDKSASDHPVVFYTAVSKMVRRLVMHPGQRAAARQKLSVLAHELKELGVNL